MTYYKQINGEKIPMTPEEVEEMLNPPEAPEQPEPVTLESLDHRLTDVEYIITGEVTTNAQR